MSRLSINFERPTGERFARSVMSPRSVNNVCMICRKDGALVIYTDHYFTGPIRTPSDVRAAVDNLLSGRGEITVYL